MDRTTGPPAEAIAVLYQTLVHNHPVPRGPPGGHRHRARRKRSGPRRPTCGATAPEPSRPSRSGPGQSSTCRAIRRWTARPVEVLADLVPVADDPDQARTLIVDGTPVPCRDRKHEPGPHSGRHHRAGPDLQDTCTPAGRPVRVPGPAPGIAPRHESPSTDRSPRQSPGHAATGRQGPHRTGHDNPDTETTRGRTRGPAETAQQDHQFITGPDRNRTSNSPTEDPADTPHRLPQTPPHLPTNHHSSHRTPIPQE